MKKIITYGTFDLLHRGHINLLRNAKNLGDCLYVGLSDDQFNQIKGKKSYFSYEDRAFILSELQSVDFVFPESTWEQKKDDIIKYGIDVFVIGDDWEGKFDELKAICEVVYLPRTKEISTTKIIKDLNDKHISRS